MAAVTRSERFSPGLRTKVSCGCGFVLRRRRPGARPVRSPRARRRTIHWRPSWTPLAARSRTCRSCVTSISMMPADQSICVLAGYSPGRAGLHCNRRPAGHCHLPCPRAKRLRRTCSTRHAPPPSRTSTGTMGGKGLNIYQPFPELCESAPARSKARSVVRVSKQSRRSLSSVPQEFAPVPLR